MQLFSLPPSLLLLVAGFTTHTSSHDTDVPRGLAQHVKYFPEYASVARRDLHVQQRIQKEKPVAVRKMSTDPGEKFYLDYWRFTDTDQAVHVHTNQSLLSPLENALPFHINYPHNSTLDRFPRYLDPRHLAFFSKRAYQCPTGTYACTSVNKPNSCCSTDSTCQLVTDTGLGDVGCCPAGQTCGGALSDCAAGYTSCRGGGCCLPGYGCFDVGCLQTDTATVLVPPATTYQPSTITVTSTVWVTPAGGAPIIQTSTYTTVVPGIVVTTSSSSYVPPPITTTTTTTQAIISTTTRSTSSYSCPTDFRSCPASLGGGCCHTDRACGSGSSCPATSASTRPGQPVLPITTTTYTSTTTSSLSVSGCPTGFYACSAYYDGGCCQVDRNCDKTSCPTRASTTLVSSNGITAVAPTGSGITAPGNLLTGNCANGWATCAPSVGGGCCPSGYACGVTACSATASGGGGSQIGKEAPSTGHVGRRVDLMVMACAISLSSVALGLGLWL